MYIFKGLWAFYQYVIALVNVKSVNPRLYLKVDSLYDCT